MHCAEQPVVYYTHNVEPRKVLAVHYTHKYGASEVLDEQLCSRRELNGPVHMRRESSSNCNQLGHENGGYTVLTYNGLHH